MTVLSEKLPTIMRAPRTIASTEGARSSADAHRLGEITHQLTRAVNDVRPGVVVPWLSAVVRGATPTGSPQRQHRNNR